ncbi:MAG: hypothetical protein WDN46_19070 [Methylocella sp.]
MTPEEKKAAEIDAVIKSDKAKKDAEAAAVVPEKVLSALDACMSKLDALEGKIAALGESPRKRTHPRKTTKAPTTSPTSSRMRLIAPRSPTPRVTLMRWLRPLVRLLHALWMASQYDLTAIA